MDLIDRQAAIDAIDEIESEVADGYGFEYAKWRKYFCDLPPAQPEITLESAIDYLHSIGWMQNHDRILTESAQPSVSKEEMVGDAVSRQAAIDATWFEPSYTDPLNVLTEVRDRLKELPSAQPKSYREGYQAGYKAGQRDAQAHTEEEP